MPTPVIFGDVHGESGKLRALIDEARERWGDCTFYGLGDYIDRGKDSKGVIQTCIDEGVQGILGNHEQWFLDFIETRIFKDGALHPVMGGANTLRSYGLGIRWPEKHIDRCVPKDHQSFFRHLPLYRSLEVAGTTYWLIHAGIGETSGQAVLKEVEEQLGRHNLTLDDIPEKVFPETFERANPDEILWNHFNPKKNNIFKLPHGGVQVIGHTPIKEPRDEGHFIALDTGCGRKKTPNSLSGVALHDDGTRTLFSVP